MRTAPRSRPITPTRAVIAAATLAMVVAAGCSGDDGDAATTTESSSTTAPPPATEPPASTTDAPTTTEGSASSTTEAPATTDSPTTTTDAPTSTETPAETTEPPTTDPPLMTEAAVEQTLIAIHEALADCLGRMPDCDVAATAATYATGALRDGVLDILTSMSERGIRIDNVDSRTIVVESIQIDENANEASAITCENDGAVQTRPDGTIEDDTYVSRRRDWSLVLQDGRWLAVDSVLLEEAIGEGNGLCDA